MTNETEGPVQVINVRLEHEDSSMSSRMRIMTFDIYGNENSVLK